MKRLATFILFFALLSIVVAQKVDENSSDQSKNKINSVDGTNETQAAGDKVIFKDGTIKLLEIENLDNAGGLILYDAAVIGGGTGKYIMNLNGNLMWDGNQLGLASGGVSAIGDLSDAINDEYSLYLGTNVGTNDDGSNNYNTGVGTDALNLNYDGSFNTAIGVGALFNNSSGIENFAGGNSALSNNTTGSNNIGIGSFANFNNQQGNNNVILGNEAGYGTALHNKSGNIFIGFQSGYNELGSNKLYIENSNSATPLIYGEFDNDLISINGKLGIGVIPTAPFHLKGSSEIGVIEFSGIQGWMQYRNSLGNVGYIGSFTGSKDMDVGTDIANPTGELHLVTQETTRVSISPSGDVDIVTGELNRSTKTGAANLLPIAFGNIAANGTINSGTGNFTVVWNNSFLNYEITITNENYNTQDYPTMLTSFSADRVVSVSSTSSGTLKINSRDFGNSIYGQGAFSFIVYKP